MGILFESLDFLYVPAPDIEAAIGYGVLGSRFRAVVAFYKALDFHERHMMY